jgi:hypothetical protein
MSNFDTVKSITDNLQTICQGEGIKFSRKTFEEPKNVPAALIPLGEIYYDVENFDQTHGQRASFAEVDYTVKIILKERDSRVLMRQQQEWVHKLRDAITVNALNIGDLASSKLVSWVDMTEGAETEDDVDWSRVNFPITIRYREAAL